MFHIYNLSCYQNFFAFLLALITNLYIYILHLHLQDSVQQNKNEYLPVWPDRYEASLTYHQSSSKTTESVKKLTFLFVRWFDSRKGHYLRFCLKKILEDMELKNNEGNIHFFSIHYSIQYNYIINLSLEISEVITRIENKILFYKVSSCL